MLGQAHLPAAEIHCTVTTRKPFLQADFLAYLECVQKSDAAAAGATMPTLLAPMLMASPDRSALSPAGEYLIPLLQARRAMLQAAFDTELAADELRRYQKFVKPGQPSSHIVGLRQKQGAARQASSVAKQSFVKAATAFVRQAGIEVPPRVALDVFVDSWIDAHIPRALGTSA
jgi:hypothetical protein